MHMVLMIVGGIVLAGLFLLFERMWGGPTPDFNLVAKLFVAVWAVIALVNMWVGVTKAGYSVRDELPVLLAVFAAPVAIVCFAIWRLAR